MFDGAQFGREIVAAVKASQEPLIAMIVELRLKLEETNAFIRTFQHVPGPAGPVGPMGETGAPGINGMDGKDGEPGRDGRDGLPGRDGKDGKDGLDGKEGSPGKDGTEGVNFDDVRFEISEDGRSITERYFKDNKLRYEFSRPARRGYRGYWKHDEAYLVDDTVMYGGCMWICLTDTKAKPGSKNDATWQMMVRKGLDGKDGERGPPGPAGPPGKNASY